MARTKYVAGNWKMNMDKAGAVALAQGLVENLKGLNAKYMIAPPFVCYNKGRDSTFDLFSTC